MKIIWTDFATKSLKAVFDYYAEYANSKVAHKIRKEILKSTRRLSKHTEIGQTEFFLEKLNQTHRYIVSGNYKIIYRVENDKIIISDVFDTRQNPTKMNDERR
ncbi:MAG TPA: type II toxin-antitoxin system RelE/ParE family toxin [Crocinitomicaceae bacterium]|nr:type II toxin-antitoxin system RelE/ParE family toxin [Crocinitomicaceae bacterium]